MFFSRNPIPTEEITPIPQIFAAAEASPDKEISIPIPPCMIGTGILRSAILKDFIY
jgi:hypothetical protein